MSQNTSHDIAAPLLPDLLPRCEAALADAEAFVAQLRSIVAQRVAPGGQVDAGLLDSEQYAAHGFAWFAT